MPTKRWEYRGYRLATTADNIVHVLAPEHPTMDWDETTLRKAGSRTDPYAVFTRRLESGDPPDSWADLIKAAKPLKP